MGVNLIPEILLRREVDESDYMKEKYWVTERLPDFDSIRYVGDRAFVWESDLNWINVVDDENTMSRDWSRPADLNAAKEWIKSNVPEGNQPRLLDLMDKMEADPRIYIYISY